MIPFPEVIGVAWIYGLYNYLDDIEFMLNIRLGWYWKICWGLVIPIFLTIVLVYSLADNVSPSYKAEYPAIALGSTKIQNKRMLNSWNLHHVLTLDF